MAPWEGSQGGRGGEAAGCLFIGSEDEDHALNGTYENKRLNLLHGHL